MKYSKIMRERIQRVSVIFKELGYSLEESSNDDQSFSAYFRNTKGAFGECYIDLDNKFLEIAYSFSFTPTFSQYLQERLPEILRICYEFGCYFNVQYDSEITISVFSKIYFAGLNYYALRETLRDYRECIQSLGEILELKKEKTEHEDP